MNALGQRPCTNNCILGLTAHNNSDLEVQKFRVFRDIWGKPKPSPPGTSRGSLSRVQPQAYKMEGFWGSGLRVWDLVFGVRG